MKFEQFVNKLQAAGWKDTGDAQHDGIYKLWKELFPLHAKIEDLEEYIEILLDDTAY